MAEFIRIPFLITRVRCVCVRCRCLPRPCAGCAISRAACVCLQVWCACPRAPCTALPASSLHAHAAGCTTVDRHATEGTDRDSEQRRHSAATKQRGANRGTQHKQRDKHDTQATGGSTHTSTNGQRRTARPSNNEHNGQCCTRSERALHHPRHRAQGTRISRALISAALRVSAVRCVLVSPSRPFLVVV